MNPQATREALLKIAAGFTELALSIEVNDQPARRASVSPPTSAPAPSYITDDLPPMDDEAPRQLPQASRATPPPTESAFTECPAHRKEWTDGKFGPYCSAASEDPSPDWTNAKGYCRITPKNAGAWLRKHGRAA